MSRGLGRDDTDDIIRPAKVSIVFSSLKVDADFNFWMILGLEHWAIRISYRNQDNYICELNTNIDGYIEFFMYGVGSFIPNDFKHQIRIGEIKMSPLGIKKIANKNSIIGQRFHCYNSMGQKWVKEFLAGIGLSNFEYEAKNLSKKVEDLPKPRCYYPVTLKHILRHFW